MRIEKLTLDRAHFPRVNEIICKSYDNGISWERFATFHKAKNYFNSGVNWFNFETDQKGVEFMLLKPGDPSTLIYNWLWTLTMGCKIYWKNVNHFEAVDSGGFIWKIVDEC